MDRRFAADFEPPRRSFSAPRTMGPAVGDPLTDSALESLVRTTSGRVRASRNPHRRLAASPRRFRCRPRLPVARGNSQSKGDRRPLSKSAEPPAMPAPARARLDSDPIARARQVIADCKAKYATVQDYTCTFFKRERFDGKLYTPHIITMKARTSPVEPVLQVHPAQQGSGGDLRPRPE